MTNRSLVRAAAVTVVAMAAIASFAGCSPKNDSAQNSSTTPSNAKLSADQLRHIHLYTVAQAKWHKTVDANGRGRLR